MIPTHQNNPNLDVDIDLRAWKELGHDSSLKRLFQVKAHLCRLAVPVRSPLPLRCAEGGHAVLTVDHSPVMPSPAARASHLGGDTHILYIRLTFNLFKIIELK